jgi:hypothetical protein
MTTMSTFTQKSRSGTTVNRPSSLETTSHATLQQVNNSSQTTAQLSLQEKLNLSPNVQSQIQLQQLLDGSPRVMTQARLAESMNHPSDASPPQQAIQRQESEVMEGAAADELAAEPIQLKMDIAGSRDFDKKGKLEIRMEERYKGSGGGEYGIIRFKPAKDDGTDANKIDLVQIASMTTNKHGQAAADQKQIDKNVEEEHNATSGTTAVKDLWRTDTPERYHIDLTGDKLKPRSTSDDSIVEDAYNAERRGGKWDNPFNKGTMGNPGRETFDNNSAFDKNSDKWADDTKPFTISQDPGYRHGQEIRPAEMLDFPSGPDPAVFSFHTTVDADGKKWGTVKWGFTTIKDLDQIVVDTTQGPTFEEGETAEMTEARLQFDNVMANPSGWTSPETLEGTEGLLDSKDKSKQNEGLGYLDEIAKYLVWVLALINETTDEAVFERFAGPHLNTASQILDLMKKNRKSDEDLYKNLFAADKKLMLRLRG